MFKIINYLAYSLLIFLIVYLTSGKVKTVVNSFFFTDNAAVYWVSAMGNGEDLAERLDDFDGKAIPLHTLTIQYSKLNQLFYEGSLQKKVNWELTLFEPKILFRNQWLNNLESILKFNFYLLEYAKKNQYEEDILFYQGRLLDAGILLIKSDNLYSRFIGHNVLKRLLNNGVDEIFNSKLLKLKPAYFDILAMLEAEERAFETDSNLLVSKVYDMFTSLENEDVHLLQQNLYRQANVIEKEFFTLLIQYAQTDNNGYLHRFNSLKDQLMVRTQAKDPVYSHAELLERYKSEFLYFVSEHDRRQYSLLSYKIMSDYMRTFLQFDYLTFIDTVKFNQVKIEAFKRLNNSDGVEPI